MRSVPRLYGLDLSGAEVADLDVVGDLKGLRYLALSPDQWAGCTPPPDLSAACTISAASLDAALEWAAGLGLDTTAALRHSGRVTSP